MWVMSQDFHSYLKNVTSIQINVNQKKIIIDLCKILTYNPQFINTKLVLKFLTKFHCLEILYNSIGFIQLLHIMGSMVKLLLFKKIPMILKMICCNMDKARILDIFLDYHTQCHI